jgi:hypothetical protein
MPASNIDSLLDQLDNAKITFDPRQQKALIRLLSRLAKLRFRNPDQLLRYHESLLFLRAYPQSAAALSLVERELKSFEKRVGRLKEEDADINSLEVPEASGIAGTSVTDTFSYFIVCWLTGKHLRQIGFDWAWFEDENRLAETWPRFMPLLMEDASVEANVPYREWLRRARGKQPEVKWLIEQFKRLPINEAARAELYDSQKLYVTWSPPFEATRTGMKLPVSKIFYHRTPLIPRREVRFSEELERPLPRLTSLSERDGSRILDMARQTSTLRYRELYGFTHGDPKRVFHVDLGRGVDLFVILLPPACRLPWRAYHAAMIFKNGVPVGYFEGLSLFERIESGFNLYYSFREGETAWIYARTLSFFRHLLGVTTFTLDPYQIGYENEEGIESGAFWFYRKLGFRSARRDLRRLTEREEEKIATRKPYRTPARVLRQLSEASMIYELRGDGIGDWDNFQMRNVGFAVQRAMANHGGDSKEFRDQAAISVSRALDLCTDGWSEISRKCFSDFAVVLSLIPDLSRWSSSERQLLVRILRAKSNADESRYLKLMQQHLRLRREVLRLGSR